MVDLISGFKKLVSDRKKKIDDAGAPSTPAPSTPLPEVDSGSKAPIDPNTPGGKKYLEMKEKYGAATGGVISSDTDKTLLRRKAEVLKKRGC